MDIFVNTFYIILKIASTGFGISIIIFIVREILIAYSDYARIQKVKKYPFKEVRNTINYVKSLVSEYSPEGKAKRKRIEILDTMLYQVDSKYKIKLEKVIK